MNRRKDLENLSPFGRGRRRSQKKSADVGSSPYRPWGFSGVAATDRTAEDTSSYSGRIPEKKGSVTLKSVEALKEGGRCNAVAVR